MGRYSNPDAANSRASRAKRKLTEAYERIQESKADAHDATGELHAMESIAFEMFERAQEGDTVEWRKKLLDLSAEAPDALRELILAGCLQDELYSDCFQKLRVVAGARAEAKSEETKRQVSITQAQFVALVEDWLAALEHELDAAVYARVGPRLIERSKAYGVTRAAS